MLTGVTGQVVEERGFEAIARNPQMLELVRLDQASGAVVLENHPVTPHHIASVALFRRIKPVADQFENDIVTRQREDEHHHPARAFRRDETVIRLLQMADEVAVEFGLRMPVKTDRVV